MIKEEPVVLNKPDFIPPPSKPTTCGCKFEHIGTDTEVGDKSNMNNGFASARITRVDTFFCPSCLKMECVEKFHLWQPTAKTPRWCKIECLRLLEEYNRSTRR